MRGMVDTRTISQLEAEGYPLDWMRVLWLRVLQGHGVGAVQDDPREAADVERDDAR